MAIAGSVAHTDDFLLSRLQEHSLDAFNELYARYWERLYAMAYKRLGVKEIAEEIVQDCFIVLWEKRETIQVTSLSAYLSAIVKYSIFHYIAREKNIATRRKEATRETPETPLEEMVDNKLLLRLIEDWSDELPQKSRLIFQYNKLKDYSITQTAKALNIAPKTAEAHITRTLKHLRAWLQTISIFFF